MNDMVQVWEFGQLVEVPRDHIVWTERSRIMAGRDCETLRYLGYEAGPNARGVHPVGGIEELMIGHAVHYGIGEMLKWGFWGGEVEEAKKRLMFKDCAHGAALKLQWAMNDVGLEKIYPHLLEEGQRITVAGDATMLTEALVYGFGLQIFPELEAHYELVEVEDEIPWVLDRWPDGRVVVVQSRVDITLKDRYDRFVAAEMKTTKEWRDWKLKEIRIDTQGITQLEALAQKYGQEPGGTQYIGLIKGPKRHDYELGLDRHQTSLFMPWTRLSSDEASELIASDYAWSYEWMPEGEEKSRRLGTKWKRRRLDIPVTDWLDMVADDQIRQPGELRGESWLAESLIFGDLILRTSDVRDRWKAWARRNEREWHELMRDEREWSSIYRPEGVWLTRHTIFPQLERATDNSCHRWGRECMFYDFCHADKVMEVELGSNRWEERTPNHPTEMAPEGAEED